MRALVVEDDGKIAEFIGKALKAGGYAVDCVDNGEEGLQYGLSFPYDVAVMDLMLPRLDGLSVIERWRAREVHTPVLILSAKRSLDDRVKGLQAGGDDYLTKPFAIVELMARVQALVRRSSHSAEPVTLSYADLSLNLITREVRRGSEKVVLQAREFALLEYLLRNATRVVSKMMILEHIWNVGFDPSTNVVDVLVCRLRNKVDRGFEPKLIHTLRGAGYVLRRP